MPKIIDNHWLTISFGVLISILVILAPEKDKEPHSKIVNYGPERQKCYSRNSVSGQLEPLKEALS